jgi:DNA-binding response OmpR family regulator
MARVRVLVVDDEPYILKLLGHMLSKFGAETVTADGPAALRLLAERDFDVVLSDVQMPEVDGFAVLECARRLRPGATRVLMSANPFALGRVDGDFALARFLLAKPIDFDRLRAIVEGVAPAGTWLDAIVESMRRRYAGSGDSVFVKDPLGRYLFMSAAGARLLERPVADVVGRLDTEIFDGATLLEEVRASDQEVMRTGRHYLYLNTMRVGGVTRTAISVKLPVRDAAGSVVAIACLSRDVTALLKPDAADRAAQVEALLLDLAELAKVLGVGAGAIAIDRPEVERCLKIPAHVADRILVVEGDDSSHDLAVRLRDSGYEVDVAHDGHDAWELLERGADGFDAVILDVTVPRREGVPFEDRVRARWPGIGVLIVSGGVPLDLEPASPPTGSRRRPVSRRTLIEILAQLLDAR